MMTDETRAPPLHSGFFRQEGSFFTPLPVARGPWNPESLNGRVVAGLLGCELERRHGGPGWIPARLTVDLYRLPGFDPVEVETRVVREGRRIRVVDATFLSNGKDVARATCQLLATGENAAGPVWKPSCWDATPEDPVTDSDLAIHPWDMRFTRGGFAAAGQRRAWIRELGPMVAGQAITPYARVAAACDFASPVVHSGARGLGYINTDVTLTLHRRPASEWIGFETTYHDADDGVAVGECRLYDEHGPIGLVSCVALAQTQAIIPR